MLSMAERHPPRPLRDPDIYRGLSAKACDERVQALLEDALKVGFYGHLLSHLTVLDRQRRIASH